MKKILICILALTLIIGSFTGCNSTDSDSNNSGDITIYAGSTIFDSSLDPIKGGMSYGYSFTNNALITVDINSAYVGDLAESWEISKDALTYTFKLKEGIKFHDGTSLTSKDVVFTYNEVRENQGNNENVDLTVLKDIKAIDDNTVEFTLSEPYSSFIDQIALLGIVPADSYDAKTFDSKPIGTGPWEIVQYDTDQKIIVKANSEYYGGELSISQVTIMNMDSDTAIANAKSGMLDVVMVDSNYTDEEIEGMSIKKLKTMDVRQISLPVAKAKDYTMENGKKITVGNDVTADPAVRKALSVGINRQTVIDNALNGVGKPTEGFTTGTAWGNPALYDDSKKDEASAIMEKAGWKRNENDIYEKNGQICQFTVISPAGDNERYQLATAVSEEAKSLGISIVTEQKTWDEITDLSRSNGVVWGWGQFNPILLKNLFYTNTAYDDGYNNTVGYSNKNVDKLIDQALSSTDRENVNTLWKEVQDETSDDYAYLYIVNIEHSYFVKDGLDISEDTQIPHPHGHGIPIINNMKDWKLN